MWRSTGWHLLLMLDGKDTLLHILAWKRSVLRREIENVSINESHSANESHISTLHSAQTSAVLYLWTNRSLEDGASGSVNRQWNQFRLWLQGVFFNVQKKGLRACVRDTVRKWSHIIYFLLQYMVCTCMVMQVFPMCDIVAPVTFLATLYSHSCVSNHISTSYTVSCSACLILLIRFLIRNDC